MRSDSYLLVLLSKFVEGRTEQGARFVVVQSGHDTDHFELLLENGLIVVEQFHVENVIGIQGIEPRLNVVADDLRHVDVQ